MQKLCKASINVVSGNGRGWKLNFFATVGHEKVHSVRQSRYEQKE